MPIKTRTVQKLRKITIRFCEIRKLKMQFFSPQLADLAATANL